MNTFVQYFMKYNEFEILILWACSPLLVVGKTLAAAFELVVGKTLGRSL